jgi:SAM-dependent methyltransferase
LLWLYLRNKTNLFSEDLSVLHFAPERVLQDALCSMRNLKYVSTDLYSPLAMVRMDIQDASFRERSFDVILCSHVLEHVPDDVRAMRELFRMLKPGGWAALQVPMEPGSTETLEGGETMSPEERVRLFDADDHVRIYGRDYGERLEKAGFVVRADAYASELGDEAVRRYGLVESEEVYLCRRP